MVDKNQKAKNKRRDIGQQLKKPAHTWTYPIDELSLARLDVQLNTRDTINSNQY